MYPVPVPTGFWSAARDTRGSSTFSHSYRSDLTPLLYQYLQKSRALYLSLNFQYTFIPREEAEFHHGKIEKRKDRKNKERHVIKSAHTVLVYEIPEKKIRRFEIWGIKFLLTFLPYPPLLLS